MPGDVAIAGSTPTTAQQKVAAMFLCAIPRLIRRSIFPALLLLAAPLLHAQIFVADSEENTIGEYNFDGSPINATLISDTREPRALAVVGTTLFVADQMANRIAEYDTSGHALNLSFITNIDAPTGLAVANNRLYVFRGFQNQSISEYDATTGVAINAALITTGLTDLDPIALSSDGKILYVCSGFGITSYDAATGQLLRSKFVPVGTRSLVADDKAIYASIFPGVAAYSATSGATLATSTMGFSFNEALALNGSTLYTAGSQGVRTYSTDGALINNRLVPLYGSSFNAIAVVPEPTLRCIFGVATIICFIRRPRIAPTAA